MDWSIAKIEDAKNIISSNWHTDNVGSRLKAFVCIEGDGSMPTAVIPSSKRIPSFNRHLFNSLSELSRWLGVQWKKNMNLKF